MSFLRSNLQTAHIISEEERQHKRAKASDEESNELEGRRERKNQRENKKKRHFIETAVSMKKEK